MASSLEAVAAVETAEQVAAMRSLAEVRAVAVGATQLVLETQAAAASAWLVWDTARAAVNGMPEDVSVGEQHATMDAVDAAEQAYGEA